MYLGNESPLPGAWPTIFSDMARDEGGLLLYAEHRYYGESMPLGNRSLTNEGLVYLTVEQVLADYAELVTAVRKLNNVPRSAPTICYGGSYGGNLAAYLRLQYPRQFDAALASSAVVKFLMPAIPFLKTKYDSYKVMTNALLDAAGKECASRVNRAYATMQGGLAYSAEGRQKLAAALHMCQPAALDSSEAVNAVGSVIRDVWWGTFQTMYRANPKFNAAAAMCKIVNAAPATDLGAVEGVAQAVIAAEFEDDKCIPSEAAIFPFGSEDNGPNATDDPIMRAWMYQCCRQGFTVSTHMWSAYPSIYGYWAMPVQFFKDWCTRVYGVKNPLQYPRQFTYTPHKLFAGTSNLIFSNGEYDPWAAGSVFTAQAPRVPAIMTPKASHRQDLSAAQAGNTAAFNATQRQIKSWIREWVLTPKHHWE
ncbi:lysosomal Pro-X carboxypeptidase [Chlorella sorokiniana]|uniref:Lysosomal Pro-X carboxypeptidase n=1 Tax=Chlorella sorokiniana TaxID=3076 RepID=A0A2P6TID8_CHLSO|nr:lysosomal Pro-X carboxypeptidase [Chlorella sorokiniana]|eukprot:PRW34050.1 lysosomal Pro-X carboxypeptidase [Chlorella sorokiniana]